MPPAAMSAHVLSAVQTFGESFPHRESRPERFVPAREAAAESHCYTDEEHRNEQAERYQAIARLLF